jgi:hypothetical protein
LRRIFDRGGLAFVQDPLTAESPTMPSAAIRCVPDAHVQPIEEIATALAGLSADEETLHRPPRESHERPTGTPPYRPSPGGA